MQDDDWSLDAWREALDRPRPWKPIVVALAAFLLGPATQVLLITGGFGLGVGFLPAIPLVFGVAVAAAVMAGLFGGLLGGIALVLARDECRATRIAQVMSGFSIALGCGFAIWLLTDEPAATRFMLDLASRLD